ncbi:MAG: cupredoxin domain-containing protein [Candidatus Levybacteria bacterium]|nr:cupredoxin domain-containing protein [Candidatus Levybacteria bacterium]MDZ4228159.1 cupredoxin domain-containing protein [Candidatus Levybacteria bacterium]
MAIDKILVVIASVGGIIFTYWYFLMKKEEVVSVIDSIDITVDGGYSPDTISVPLGKTTKINFLRKDSSSCLEEVVLGDFKIRKFLPLNKTVTVEITPEKSGKYSFTCGMGMFHGKIIAK